MQAGAGGFVLRGTGKALPVARLDNDELGRQLGVDPESIFERTGIRERRVAAPGDTASSLGAAAAEEALAAAGVRAADLDLVVLSTYTPDRLLCPTGPELAHRIGALRAGAFDVNAACSGGVTALLTGVSLLGTGAFRNALVVTSDLTTRYIRDDDSKTRLIFGDGAAALVIEAPQSSSRRAWQVLAATMGADGSGANLFHVPDGGTLHPPSMARINGHHHEEIRSVVMNGRAIFRFGVERGAEIIRELYERAGLRPEEVDWVIPHQANLRIITALREKVEIPHDRWVINIERYGNTASASVPLALAEWLDEGRIRSGQTVMLAAFGAGLTWCGVVLRAP